MIGGEAYPIRTDFRTAVRYALLVLGGDLTEEQFFSLWFPEQRPENLEEALRAVGQFYHMGRPPAEGDGPTPYDLGKDAGAIFAAFRRHYGIDLSRESMHWWHFLSLLEGLITHSFRQRVGYRTADLRGRSAEERAEILRYRRMYALEGEEDLPSHLRYLEALAARARREQEANVSPSGPSAGEAPQSFARHAAETGPAPQPAVCQSAEGAAQRTAHQTAEGAAQPTARQTAKSGNTPGPAGRNESQEGK